MHTTATRIIGTQPTGNATGAERWATIRTDDATVIVTAYRGWLESDAVTLTGATAATLADAVAALLVADLPTR